MARFYHALLLLNFSLICACSSSTWQAANDTFKISLAEHRKAPAVDIETVKKTPYFQIAAEYKNVNSVLLLTRINQNRQYWQNAAQESLVLQNGLIVRTTGLNTNLQQTRFSESNPFAAGLLNVSYPFSATRIIDLSPYRYGIQVHSVFTEGPEEPVEILGLTRKLKRIDEKIEAADIGLGATNHYWLDEKGFIWKSEQNLWNNYKLIITQLKPYGVNP